MISRALAAALALALVGCLGARPADTAGDRRGGRRPGAQRGSASSGSIDDRVPQPPERTPEKVAPSASPSRVVVKAASRALAASTTTLYYGDVDDDGVFAVKKDGEPTRIARRAPVAGGLALDNDMVAWIASPGDVVLRAPLQGGQPSVLRDKGIFAAVAAQGGDVFIAEAVAAGGAITRITNATTTRTATFDGPPRGLAADHAQVYVATPTHLYKTPRDRGELTTLASGTAFERLQIDAFNAYLVAAERGVRVLVSVPKGGGPMTTLARDVRDAPIAVLGGEIYYFDASQPQLRAIKVAGGEPRIVAESPALARPAALATDGREAFVATGEGPTAAILAFALR
ncbi:MAG: hypothetical protein KF819_37525 [Labilithrix sp.]|nr:hypothetical protein [Labilithrix sp.]